MTKADLIRAVRENVGGLSARQAQEAVETVIDQISHAIMRKSKTRVHGLGTFDVLYRDPRPGTNPATGERIQIPGRYVVKFKASRSLVKAINE